MSHSNQCEDSKCQTKQETEREEAAHASTTFFHGEQHRCFFDDQPATALLNGVYLCESHAVCNTCLKSLTEQGLMCQCHKEGYTGHEKSVWCSEGCMEARHPEPDRDDQEEGE